MAQRSSRLIRATLGASVLAAAMNLQPLTAAPAAGGQTDQGTSTATKMRGFRAQEGERGQKNKDGKKNGDKKSDESKKRYTKDERRELITRAQVWAPTNIPEMDMRRGPDRAGAFEPGEEVACDYVYVADLPGTSRKFDCAITTGDVVKVRYGGDNGKVQGEVLATRLLWALGFGADAVYPVTVRCRGCSADPWKDRQPVAGEQLFDPAAIERKFPGDEIKTDQYKDAGFSWKELDRIDERLGGAPRAQVDAMKLLAVFMQHTDNKVANERFVCLPGGKTPDGQCTRPFLFMHDVGLVFGHANLFDDNNEGSVSYEDWVSTPIWRGDSKMCVGHMRRSATGMLGDPQISEAGRQFLVDLLVQLTDQQLHDLFDIAGVGHRSRKPGTEAPSASVDEWVAAFKDKRDQIVTNRCDK